MAFVHGSNTQILLDGADVSTYFRELSTSIEVTTAETTTFRKRWKTHIPGVAGGEVTLSGLYEPAFDSAPLMATGSVLTIGPAGLDTAGQMARLVSVVSASYSESSSIGDAVLFDWDVTADTPLGAGHILEPLTAISVDANGTTFDGGAATTTGAVAHLHVTSVSASDSIVVTIEDSATGSSGWATIGTFASKSAPGAERITIDGTVRRYVRAVFDVTGTAVSITCAVALART